MRWVLSVAAVLCLLPSCSGGDGGGGPGPADPEPQHPCEAEALACGGGCVDPQRDPRHCGACEHACGEGESCVEGSCVLACPEGELACGGTCVDPQNSSDHCGGCDQACAGEVEGGARRCEEGRCTLVCDEGFTDCDGDPSNGCEVVLESDPSHCGSCGASCEGEVLGGRLRCRGGECALLCDEGFTECDGACVATETSNDHCGSCGNVCGEAENGFFRCLAGACELVCEDGWGDCDGDPENGCEANLHVSVAHCSICGNDCSAGANVASAACTQGGCQLTCEPLWGDCDLNPLNGCEQYLGDDPSNCGVCNLSCSTGIHVESATCVDGKCQLVCEEGWGFCDDDPSNGCRFDVLNDSNHCGTCGNACSVHCSNGSCVGVLAIAAGSQSTCALLDDGRAWCWGSNRYAVLGSGDTESVHFPAGVKFGPVDTLRLGDKHACALRDGKAYCWGNGVQGQIGDGGSGVGHHVYVPTAVIHSIDFVQIDAGTDFTCAIAVNGEVHCWGNNYQGQLGQNPTGIKAQPAVVPGLPPSDQVSTGEEHACVVTKDGELWCWGTNRYGELGIGSTSDRELPVKVAGLVDVRQVAAGREFTCAIHGDGKVSCWGQNNRGQLGDGSQQNRWVPTEISLPEKAERLEVRSSHGCALLAGGRMACWGNNTYGQAGGPKVGAGALQLTPIVIDELEEVDAVAVGGDHTCAITAGGQAWCWGRNREGQIGDRSTTDRPLPVFIEWPR